MISRNENDLQKGLTQNNKTVQYNSIPIGCTTVAQRTVIDDNVSSINLPTSQSKVFTDASNKIQQYRADSRGKRRNIMISPTQDIQVQ